MKPAVYFLLGMPGAGRREVLADLLENEYSLEHPATVWIHPDEPDIGHAPVYASLEFVGTRSWTMRGKDPNIVIAAPAPDPRSDIFVLLHGPANPVDQLEAWKRWLQANALDVSRVLTVVHCAFVSQHSEAEEWYDACIHFSDAVLLNRRENVPNKWVNRFLRKYEKACYPCIFDFVRKGRVQNPAFILTPEPRRLSLLFEEMDPEPDIEFVVIDDETGSPIEDDAEDDDRINLDDDPYLARIPTGLRRKRIPDIATLMRRVSG